MDRDDDPCKLFVGGLTRSTTTEMLHQYFEKFGELTDCIVIKNPTTKLSRCFGFVQFSTSQIADLVVDSRPHFIDGKEIDVKHASAESHERHQQQLAAAAAAGHERISETSPDRQKKRSRWEIQQTSDLYRNDLMTIKSNSHIAFIQRDTISYPIPLKYLREDFFENSNFSRMNFNNRIYQN